MWFDVTFPSIVLPASNAGDRHEGPRFSLSKTTHTAPPGEQFLQAMNPASKQNPAVSPRPILADGAMDEDEIRTRDFHHITTTPNSVDFSGIPTFRLSVPVDLDQIRTTDAVTSTRFYGAYQVLDECSSAVSNSPEPSRDGDISEEDMVAEVLMSEEDDPTMTQRPQHLTEKESLTRNASTPLQETDSSKQRVVRPKANLEGGESRENPIDLEKYLVTLEEQIRFSVSIISLSFRD
jgi:hypothetical protein